MIIDNNLEKEILELLENSKPEDKSKAIFEAIDKVATARNKEITDQILEESRRAEHDKDYRESLGLAVLSKEETEFYEALRVNPRQAVTAKQVDIIPTSIIDRTLADVREASDALSLVNFAPADVKKWITGTHSGSAVWGELTATITAELTAGIEAINLEQHKLSLFLTIPKAIRELALPFVDKFFRAILVEGMQDGLEKGYIEGDGKNAPVGIVNQIKTFASNGTASAKSVLSTVTEFSPVGLKDIRKTLSNNGKRKVSELHLICNPLDEAEYVDPALFGEALTGGFRNVSFMPIVKHVTPNCPQGKAIFTIKGVYTMGTVGAKFAEYDQTKALEDADLIIGKCYANGRADDDNCAVVFNVAKLKPYVLPVTQVTAPGAGA